MQRYFRGTGAAIWIAVVFILAGLAFIRKTGLHFDAAFELACFYDCSGAAYRIVAFGHNVPIMVISYLGALKAWLYLPVLLYLEVTPFVVRLPLLLCAGVSVGMCFAFLDRISGRPAAVAGSLLLATDAVFVISSAYDFGPVVLLHFLLLAGMLLLLRFDRTRSPQILALAFFLFGLALWHKALFIWMLNGAAAGALVAVPHRIRSLVSVKRLLIAAGSLCLGASPLIYYNVVTSGATLRTGEVMSGAAPLAQKVLILREALDGSVLFGWLTDESRPDTVRPPERPAARASSVLSRIARHPRSHLLLAAFLLSLAAVPWLWFTPSRRPVLFVAAYLTITWLQMLLLPNTGATLHHAILLWPFPHFLVAIALAELSRHAAIRGRVLFGSALMVLVASNFLLMNEYYAGLITNGTTVIWTDALSPLFSYLSGLSAHTVVTDWGYGASLCLLSDGTIPNVDISYALLNPQPEQKTWFAQMIADGNTVFVGHSAGGEMFAGNEERLGQIAAAQGYRSETVADIPDRNGRPRFRIFRFAPAARQAHP